MPRRSAADLSIVPLVPGKGRPEPPKALDQIEARAWNDVVDALPDRWLDPAGQLVLRRTVTQVAIAERLEDRLRRLAMMEDDPEALEAEADDRRHASRDREGGHPRSDGAQGDAAKPHGRAREPIAVRARRGDVAAVGDRGEEERWPGLVSNLRRPGRSRRPT